MIFRYKVPTRIRVDWASIPRSTCSQSFIQYLRAQRATVQRGEDGSGQWVCGRCQGTYRLHCSSEYGGLGWRYIWTRSTYDIWRYVAIVYLFLYMSLPKCSQLLCLMDSISYLLRTQITQYGGYWDACASLDLQSHTNQRNTTEWMLSFLVGLL